MSKQPLIENIEKIIDIKEDIKTSIIKQGVDIADDLPFSEYPEKIKEITIKPIVKVEPSYATFYDYDGTILFAYTKEEVDTLTELPTPPEHDGLVFEDWNWTLAEIKNEGKKMNIGAMYLDAEGYDFKLTFNIKSEGDKTISLSDCSVINAEIFWGDGTSDHLTLQNNISHTYEELGEYTLGIKNYANFDLNSSIPFSGINTYEITKLYVGDITVSGDSFSYLYNLNTIIMSNRTWVMSSGTDFLSYSWRLKHVNFPRNSKFMGLSESGIESICFPGCLETMDEYSLRSTNNIHSLLIPNRVTKHTNYLGVKGAREIMVSERAVCTNIGAVKFLASFKLPKINTTVPFISDNDRLYIFDLTDYDTVPTLNYTIAVENDHCYYIVKDSLVDAFKSAENWNYYASRIIGKQDWEANPRPYA